jgi:hypothetical protein
VVRPQRWATSKPYGLDAVASRCAAFWNDIKLRPFQDYLPPLCRDPKIHSSYLFLLFRMPSSLSGRMLNLDLSFPCIFYYIVIAINQTIAFEIDAAELLMIVIICFLPMLWTDHKTGVSLLRSMNNHSRTCLLWSTHSGMHLYGWVWCTLQGILGHIILKQSFCPGSKHTKKLQLILPTVCCPSTP